MKKRQHEELQLGFCFYQDRSSRPAQDAGSQAASSSPLVANAILTAFRRGGIQGAQAVSWPSAAAITSRSSSGTRTVAWVV